MKSITIAFSDFWSDFKYCDNFIVNVLSSKYHVNIVDISENPDILFYSFFGTAHLAVNPNTIKVYYSGENDVPDFNICDYGISFHYINFGNRHFRLPLYVLFHAFELLRNPPSPQAIRTDRGFCSMLVSNSNRCDPKRLSFFEQLNAYKPVSSGGKYANNVGGCVADKLSFISNYKFNIAFENSCVLGYTTEKMIDALACGTVPIYWGNPLASLEIDERAFINVHKFNSFDKAIEHIIEVDNNNELYNQYLDVNPLKNSPYLQWEKALLDFLSNIIESKIKYVTPYGGMGAISCARVMQTRLYNVTELRSHIGTIELISKCKAKLMQLFRR